MVNVHHVEREHQASELMKSEQWDTDLLQDLSQTMSDSSIESGQAASNPVKSVLKYFPDEVKDVSKPEDVNLDFNCSIKINGVDYSAHTDETMLDVSKRNGIEIPHLCFKKE